MDKAFKNLKSSDEYDNLYYSAISRNQADFLVGLNATMALSAKNNVGLLSLGRVQTPTLALVCSRYLENKNFIPEPYYGISSILYKDKEFKSFSIDKWKDKAEAEEIFNKIKNIEIAKIIKIEKKENVENVPLLFNLSLLQKEANKLFSYTANETLEIAQILYEKKYTTYPRTSSNYIGDDLFKEIPALLNNLLTWHEFEEFKDSYPTILNKKSVNAAKVTDHHAILATGVHPDIESLPEKEKNIFKLILLRVLQAFSENCIKDITAVTFNISDVLFKSTGSTIKSIGWRRFSLKIDNEEIKEEKILPSLEENASVNIKSILFNESFTSPKPLHTDGSLVDAMETCGKEVEGEDLKEAMKENGIGQEATRAGIIETIIKRNYIFREKKHLIPTSLGLQVYNAVKNLQISQVELTGIWENKLLKMEKGDYSKEVFNIEINKFTIELIESIKNSQFKIEKESLGKCPKCNGNLYQNNKAVYCENSKDNNCAFPVIFKTICKKALNTKIVHQLILNGKTDIIKGFLNSESKSFDARLKIENDKIVFDFEKEEIGLCPKCKKHQIIETQKAFSCSGYKDINCNFSIWKNISDKNITKSIAKTLIEKKITPTIKGFKTKEKKVFDAKLKLNDDFKITFSF